MSMTAELDELLATLRGRALAPRQVQAIIGSYVDTRVWSVGHRHPQDLDALEREVSAWLTAQRMSGLCTKIRQRIDERRAALVRMAERPEMDSLW